MIIDENNIFQYNSSHEYYNDICYSYTKNNADIILKDRRDEYINNNLSLCEKDWNIIIMIIILKKYYANVLQK